MWVNYLEDLLPTFTHCYTSNPLVQVLFERAGYNVTSLKLVDSRASGTRVRQLMSEENDAWQTLVPSLVAEYIRENILEKRLI
jgi:nicotinamide mononucleotide adenylyltransferase